MSIDNLYSDFNKKGDSSSLKNLYDNIVKNENKIDPEKDNVNKEDRQAPIEPAKFPNLYEQPLAEPKSIKNEKIDTSVVQPLKSRDLGNVN